jgi:predicted nucleic acid-binding protein
MLICIDANIIIWGIKRQATGGQENMIKRAEQFFKWVDQSGHDILVPSIVLAEILIAEPPEKRAKFLEILSRSFTIGSFDVACSLKCAEILHGKVKEASDLSKGLGGKQKMKVDKMIIATALRYNAGCIYTHDGGLSAFAKDLIPTRELPPEQMTIDSLFGNINTPYEIKEEDEEDPF